MGIVALGLRSEGRPAPATEFPEESLTVQAAKDECDINVIVRKYWRTGELPGLREGVFADVSQYHSLQEAIEQVRHAEERFMELPADIRRRFDNDPVKLVEFAADPSNTEEAISLGLATRRVAPSVAGSSPAAVQPAASVATDASGKPAGAGPTNGTT